MLDYRYRKLCRRIYILAATSQLMAAIALASETCGGLPARSVTVVRCYDGDTCTLSDRTKVRLAGIDTPEKKGTMGGKGQVGAEEAALAIRRKLVDRTGVLMSEHDKDRYGRTIGEFCTGGNSINVDMVREGHAMVYRGKTRSQTIDTRSFESAEAEAKAQKKGIWAEGGIDEPASYRQKLRQRSKYTDVNN